MVAHRGVVLPRAAVAPGTDGLKSLLVEDRGVERLSVLRWRFTGADEGLKTALEDS